MERFEWDENKRQSNIEKHGIDFVDAIDVFADTNRIELENARHAERRYQTIGALHDDIVILLVYTYRSQRKRIISARRASKKERDVYYSLR